MKKDDIKSILSKLVDEANVIAPSIVKFDKDRKYGQFTDEDLDYDSLSSWEIEATAIIKQLSDKFPSVYQVSHEKYLDIEKESKRFHSRSILIHKIKLLLGGMLALIESPLVNFSDSNTNSKNIMKKQCNLCGLREDVSELVPLNKTWCIVFGKEVGNKLSGCEHWHPDGSSIRNQKHEIAAEIKRSLKDKMEPEWNDFEILLEPVQQELLLTIVEAVRNTPVDNRQKFFVAQSFGGDTLIYPTIPKEKTQIYFGDVEALVSESLLSLGYGSKGTPNFDVTPRGFKYYEYLKKKLGEPVERVMKTIRTYLDSNNFIKTYPTAYEKWCSAEELLWETDSKQQLTLIGHLCRESIQEFANYLVSIHNLSNAPPDKSKTVARIKAVIEAKENSLGNSKKAFLDALVSYWGTVIDLIQRQEHDSQKEGQPLAWEDARTVVFQTLIVMFEIDRSL